MSLSRLRPLGRFVAARPLQRRLDIRWYAAAAHHENELVEKAQAVTWQGVYANLGLSAVKLVGGIVGHSTALTADAVHSFSDLLSDFVTLATVKVARAPPSENNPYGHGRFEALGALAVSGILVCSGGGIFVHSASLMLEILQPNLGFLSAVLSVPAGSDAVHEAPHAIALAICAVSIGVKEVLYQRTMVVAKETKSAVLVANAWHHRTDSLSSIVALVGIGLAQQGYALFDPAAGMIVGCMIVKAAVVDIGIDAVRELSDASIDPEVRQRAIKWAEAVEGVERVARLRSRQMGPYSHVDMVIEVQPHLSVTTAHQIAQRVRRSLIDRSSCSSEGIVTDAWVYTRPATSFSSLGDMNEPLWAVAASPSEEELRFRPHTVVIEEVKRALKRIPEIRDIAHCLVHYIDGKMSVQVDIVVDAHHTVGEVHVIASRARSRLLDCIPDLHEADVELELDEREQSSEHYAKLRHKLPLIKVGKGRYMSREEDR